MTKLRGTAALMTLFAAVVVAAADDKGSGGITLDKIVGTWQGAKGGVTSKDGLVLEKTGGFKVTQTQSGLVGAGGKKLPPTDVVTDFGSFELKGDKLIFRSGPAGKVKTTEMRVLTLKDDVLILRSPKGKKNEFKRR